MTPRTSRTKRAVVLLVALAVCGAGCRRAAVSEAERGLLLRVHDLAPFGFEAADAARYESFNKTVYFDGSSDLEYEFTAPDGSLYMMVNVTFARDKNDARMTKGGEKVGLLVGLGLEGAKLEEKHGFFKYGDESSFYVVTAKDGQPGGLFFNTREGAKVYTVLISGVYFDSPEGWAELITPKLQKFSAHKP